MSLDPQEALRILPEVDPASALFRRCVEALEGRLEMRPPLPLTPRAGEPKFLTIALVAHDYDSLCSTIRTIRFYHSEILSECEFLVIDARAAPARGDDLKALETQIPRYRYVPYSHGPGIDPIFREAAGEFVLCVGSPVLFSPGAMSKLIEYCRSCAESNDLLEGRQVGVEAPPLEADMEDLAVFACRRKAWPGLNPRLSGFCGLGAYIREKFNRAGGETICLPFLLWTHGCVASASAMPAAVERIRNGLIGHDELGRDPAPVVAHHERFAEVIESIRSEFAGPFHFFDAIYCINLDRQRDRWEAVQARFRKLGIEHKVRRFSAAETPLNHHIGCALSHRRIVAEAKEQGLQTALVFEDDVRFSPGAAHELELNLKELEGRSWQLLYLGAYGSKNSLPIAGCEHLRVANRVTCTHAIAYHCSVYDLILDAVPATAIDVALWVHSEQAIDQFFNRLPATRLLTWPVIATQTSIIEDEIRVFDS